MPYLSTQTERFLLRSKLLFGSPYRHASEVSQWVSRDSRNIDDFTYAINLLKNPNKKSEVAVNYIAIRNNRGYWIVKEGIEQEKIDVALPFITNDDVKSSIHTSLIADYDETNNAWIAKEGKTEDEIRDAFKSINSGSYIKETIAASVIARSSGYLWEAKDGKTLREISDAFDFISELTGTANNYLKVGIAASYVLKRDKELCEIRDGKGLDEIEATFELIDKSGGSDDLKSKIIFCYATQYDENSSQRRIKKDCDSQEIVALLSSITDAAKRRDLMIDILNCSTKEDKETGLFVAFNKPEIIGDPIPPLLHVVWTGSEPISEDKIKDLVKITSFGKDVKSEKDDGLKVHLWVDDANKFRNLYEKTRIGLLGGADAPRDLNCVIHSIRELGAGSNGLDFNSERGRITEELLMKSEVCKGQGRNKPASASDIARGLILDQFGGVYCDLRVAMGFIKSLERTESRKFGSMPTFVKSNFLSLGNEKHPEKMGANYAMARPNTEETLEMLQKLHKRVVYSHRIEAQPYSGDYGDKHIGVRFKNAPYGKGGQRLMDPNNNFFSADDQSRLPGIMNTGYHYGLSGYDNKLGVGLVIHTTGWVFDDVRKHRTTDEARRVTKDLFGIDHNPVVMQGAWAKLQPSRRADMADGVTGIGVGNCIRS